MRRNVYPLYPMGQIYSTRLTNSLQNHSGRKKKFFFNCSSDESFYVIELNLVSLILPKTEFFPKILRISEKVSKMGDNAREMSSKKRKMFIYLLIILMTAKNR